MTQRRGSITFRRGDRLFKYVDQFVILNAVYTIGSLWASKMLGEGLRAIDGSGIDSQIFSLSLSVPLGGVLEDAFDEKSAAQRTITIETGHQAPAMEASGAPFSQGFNSVVWLMITPIFVNFYESHRPWIEQHHGFQKTWPHTFYFANLIRNAISHGGKLYFKHVPLRTAIWQHLRYDHSDDKKQIIGAGGIFSIADLFFLMLDTSDELDRLGCPADPS
jgi:hypothetical protein